MTSEELRNNVEKALEEIRPFLQSDGGDITLVSIDNENSVKVRLEGACVGCTVNQMTLKSGVELSGTALKILQSNAEQAELQRDIIEYNGKVAEAKKCERCWHHSDDIGQNVQHPTLCGRCVENVEGDGEVRRFA